MDTQLNIVHQQSSRKDTPHLIVCDTVHSRPLERCTCGIPHKLRIVSSVDDEAKDVVGVPELSAPQEDLIRLQGVHSWFMGFSIGSAVEHIIHGK